VDLSVVDDLEVVHGQAMFGFVRRLGLSDQSAEDCVQEVLLRLTAQLANGVLIVDPRAWAFRAAYRLAMDEHRLSRRLRLIAGRLRPPPPVDPGADLDAAAVWAEVDRLTPRQRQVLYLRFRADLTFDQVGVTLGITSAAARSHATVGLQTLRVRLGAADERASRR
jgi:RNA polymerase sigma-70 factor (ECF subfamily)